MPPGKQVLNGTGEISAFSLAPPKSIPICPYLMTQKDRKMAANLRKNKSYLRGKKQKLVLLPPVVQSNRHLSMEGDQNVIHHL